MARKSRRRSRKRFGNANSYNHNRAVTNLKGALGPHDISNWPYTQRPNDMSMMKNQPLVWYDGQYRFPFEGNASQLSVSFPRMKFGNKNKGGGSMYQQPPSFYGKRSRRRSRRKYGKKSKRKRKRKYGKKRRRSRRGRHRHSKRFGDIPGLVGRAGKGTGDAFDRMGKELEGMLSGDI